MTTPDYQRKKWLIAKITSEGYCCIPGYLRLCKARGESAVDMAKNLEISPDTVWYHQRKGESCKNYSDCMKDVIDEIEKNPPVKAPKDA